MVTRFDLRDGVAVIAIDDGKANVVSHALIGELHGHLDHALADAASVCLVGRPGRFSAGFDLSEMTAGPAATRALVEAGGELILRVYGHPQPTVAAVTGHAIAAGVLLATVCDVRLGAADVPAKIGLNEVAIGMALPEFAVELARDRVVTNHLTDATVQATLYDATGAVEVGWLDQAVTAAELEAAAHAAAQRLGTLSRGAYARTKQALRGALIARLSANLAADLADLTGPEPPPASR